MKRIYLSCILLFFTISINAQWKITPEVGTTISKRFLYNAGVGLKIGANIRYSFNGEDQGFGVRSGLFYVQRNSTSFSGSEVFYTLPGSNETHFFLLAPESSQQTIPENAEVQDINAYHIKTRKDYLQLPIMAEYAWNLSSSVRYHIAAGPYVAWGISGREKDYLNSWSVGKQPESEERTSSPFSGITGDRFDVGASIQTGLQVNKFSFLLNYDINIYKRDLLVPYLLY